MKICPLMAFNADTDVLVFKNYDASEDTMQKLAELIKSGQPAALKLQDFGEPALDVIRGTCKESDCAWWSEERKCCGVVK